MMAGTDLGHSHQRPPKKNATATTASSALAPSFLVYPLPSIADESFLQLIFCNTVRRSLFLGFGRGRFAVVELTSEAVAAEVVATISKAAASAFTQEGSRADPDGAPGAAADGKVNDGVLEYFAAADDDALEKVTLADLFALPPRSSTQASASAQRAGDGGSHSFHHIPYLVWRGRPVHVVVSGVRVADFYDSGGVVPEHRVKREANAEEKLKAGKRPRVEEGSTAALSPIAGQRAAAKECPPGSSTTDVAAAAAAPAPKWSFPKGCCQKCGSADHFTRHCDGRGTTVSVAVEAGPPVVGRAAEEEQTLVGSSATAVPTAATPVPLPAKAKSKTKPLLQRTSKDQCKYCGSEAHLSRHCPG
ncbi:hypothetical protein LSCM1_08193 [Leishmania martiniquensis]|uniref:CCHC-type domain-containing protein n=1 Tax=Leishmania martiniquensis TaxID=1580590 RepID=A0A836GU07_9TRYP|nr:hypothetical protein LSCM1_08193 [Leishmania martiniquensis]